MELKTTLLDQRGRHGDCATNLQSVNPWRNRGRPEMNKNLWLRWVGANAFGEMLGLGLTFAVGAVFITGLGDQPGIVPVLASFAVAVASGAIEASIVGLAQWWAMHPWFPRVGRRSWWLATLVGALLAYVLGYLPSTIMSLGEQAAPDSGATMAEPAQWIVLLLAAGLGLVGGAVLSFAQWLVLRKSTRGSGIWVPANMLAWMIGMPMIFLGIDLSQKGQPIWWVVIVMAIVLFAAGAVVGGIHGLFLVRLAEKSK